MHVQVWGDKHWPSLSNGLVTLAMGSDGYDEHFNMGFQKLETISFDLMYVDKQCFSE